MKGIIIGLALGFGLAGAAMGAEKLDGRYHGSHDNQPVTAVLETVSTTVTGMLTIGQSRYLLQAEAQQGVYQGQLSDMANGSNMPVEFKKSDNGLNVEIRSTSAGKVRFSLQADH